MQYIFLHQICSQLVPCRLIEMFWAHCKWSQTSLTTLCSHFFLSWDNQVMIISRKIPNLKLLPLKLWNSSLTQVFSHKHLGLILTPKLTWNEHIKSIVAKANKRLFVLKHYKYRLSRKALAIGYLTFIRPVIEYGDVLYDSCNKELSDLIDNVQLEAAHTVTGAKYRSSHEALHKELGWMPLTERRHLHKLLRYMLFIKIKPLHIYVKHWNPTKHIIYITPVMPTI